ncbi:hypothetical protein Trydic_g2226 [Trypoxylus dichotomus]
MELELHGVNAYNEAAKGKRRNLLLSKAGAEPFKILVDHFKSDKVITKTFDEIVCTPDKHTNRVSFRNKQKSGLNNKNSESSKRNTKHEPVILAAEKHC